MRKKAADIFLVISAVLLLFTGYQLYSWYLEDRQSTKNFRELAENVERAQACENDTSDTDGKRMLPGYSTLYLQNEDLAGWLSVEGTDISYPVMHTPECPDYYLDHDFAKQDSRYGVPYAAGQCSVSDASDNIIIYGHNIRGGRMFGELLDYAEESFYETHRIIRFDTLTEQNLYEVAVVFKTTVYDDEGFAYYGFVNASGKEDFDAYIDECRSLALYDTGVMAEYGDKLLTLSTCEYSRKNGRFVVVARVIKQEGKQNHEKHSEFKSNRKQ